MKKAVGTVTKYIANAHLILIYAGFAFLPVNLMAVIVKGEGYDPSVWWVRVGEGILRLHASLWRGMLGVLLIDLALLIVDIVVLVHRAHSQANTPMKVNSFIVFWKYMEDLPAHMLWRGITAEIILMLLVAAVRFFQLPLPELFMHNYYLTEIWVELAYYPKTNYISAIAAMVLPLRFVRYVASESWTNP